MDGSVNFGVFYPKIIHKVSASAVSFPTYYNTDFNIGYYKEEGAFDAGWAGYMKPQLAFYSDSEHLKLQYPLILFHLLCHTFCGYVGISDGGDKISNTINSNFSGCSSFPNPVDQALTIKCDFDISASATVSITNIFGQVVLTKTVSGEKNIVATFNTSTLPDGMYFYTIITESGNYGTGHVIVAH